MTMAVPNKESVTMATKVTIVTRQQNQLTMTVPNKESIIMATKVPMVTR